MIKVLSTMARVGVSRRGRVTILLGLLAWSSVSASQLVPQEQKEEGAMAAAAQTKDLDLAEFFQGEWDMRGRFRFSEEADWIPTRSRLVAVAKLGSQVILRSIEAPQISFSALDLITYDPSTGVVQYVYLNNSTPTAFVFEGACKDTCHRLELEQYLRNGNRQGRMPGQDHHDRRITGSFRGT